MTIDSVKARKKRNRLDGLRVLIALGLWLPLEATAAIPMTTARIGLGPSFVKINNRDLTTWGNYGTFRLGAWQERLQLTAGLDLTAYRIQDEPDAGLNFDIQGNDVLFFLGYTAGPWNLWGGMGAGQMRIYDREEPDHDEPHRSISQVTEAGVSFDLYRAQYGKIDTSLTWRRMVPEKGWRSAYALTMIDCLQFEIGFKLLGW
jgi:hypothetical protein